MMICHKSIARKLRRILLVDNFTEKIMHELLDLANEIKIDNI